MNEIAKPSSYTYTEQPQPVKARNGKYRDPFQTQQVSLKSTANLMWDRRVYRGNTYAPQIIPVSVQIEAEQKKKREKEMKRRRKQDLQRRQLEEIAKSEMEEQIEPVDGRKHIEIQTEQYLEEITDQIEEANIETQTDPFYDRPQSPQFMPAKTGVDREVQVGDDLFDFDFEVEPILEVIIGKTLEQSMLEVMQEEEMENMRRHQEEFIKMRNAELNNVQRLEAEEVRRYEEKERRKKQERERLQKEQKAKEQIQSRAYAKQFLKNLELKVFNRLEESGYFYDVVEREVETEFWPWLIQRVHHNVDKKRDVKNDVDQLIMKALNQILQSNM